MAGESLPITLVSLTSFGMLAVSHRSTCLFQTSKLVKLVFLTLLNSSTQSRCQLRYHTVYKATNWQMIEANPPPGWISNPLADDDSQKKKPVSWDSPIHWILLVPTWLLPQFSELQLHDLTQVLYRHTLRKWHAGLPTRLENVTQTPPIVYTPHPSRWLLRVSKNYCSYCIRKAKLYI